MPTTQTNIPLWHYHCTECGFSDAEIGSLAATHAIYCEVCLEEDEKHVRLKRWQADDAASGALPGGPGRS
jgi:predicted nucleic acid-binding Zn ribbon protein